MANEDNDALIAILGAGAAILFGLIGMNWNKQPSNANIGSASPPKMKTGCGCNKGL